jgi:hypothetical protein
MSCKLRRGVLQFALQRDMMQIALQFASKLCVGA